MEKPESSRKASCNRISKTHEANTLKISEMSEILRNPLYSCQSCNAKYSNSFEIIEFLLEKIVSWVSEGSCTTTESTAGCMHHAFWHSRLASRASPLALPFPRHWEPAEKRHENCVITLPMKFPLSHKFFKHLDFSLIQLLPLQSWNSCLELRPFQSRLQHGPITSQPLASRVNATTLIEQQERTWKEYGSMTCLLEQAIVTSTSYRRSAPAVSASAITTTRTRTAATTWGPTLASASKAAPAAAEGISLKRSRKHIELCHCFPNYLGQLRHETDAAWLHVLFSVDVGFSLQAVKVQPQPVGWPYSSYPGGDVSFPHIHGLSRTLLNNYLYSFNNIAYTAKYWTIYDIYIYNSVKYTNDTI